MSDAMTDMRNNKKLRDEIESLRQQLSNRDAEIAELVAALDNSIFVFELDPKIAKLLAKVRNP